MTLRSLSRHWLLLFGASFNLWAQAGPPDARVAEILVFPSSGNLLYAATDAGVFRSDNSGLSWSARNEGLTNLCPVTRRQPHSSVCRNRRRRLSLS